MDYLRSLPIACGVWVLLGCVFPGTIPSQCFLSRSLPLCSCCSKNGPSVGWAHTPVFLSLWTICYYPLPNNTFLPFSGTLSKLHGQAIERALSVKCLPCKPYDLNWILRACVQEGGTVACAGEMRACRSLGLAEQQAWVPQCALGH